MTFSVEALTSDLRKLQPTRDTYATQFVDRVLTAAKQAGASDVHLHPNASGLDVRWRLDGVLHPLGVFPRGEGSDVITRLKVLAGLLTYRQDVPQEGRIRQLVDGAEVRVSTFPSLFGERAVIRMFAMIGEYRELKQLMLPEDIVLSLTRLIKETSGALLLTGPAGSGKTTAAYACLRDLISAAGAAKSIVSLEDPIETAVDGVSQSQINAPAGFDFPTGLRSLMRQDPEVILVGEIRDSATAETVFQAALTGHLVISTFHSGSAAEAICRLNDMGIEPYLLCSGVLGILNQRLVRQLCECSRSAKEDEFLGLRVDSARSPVGCQACLLTGYRRRLPLAELLLPEAMPWNRSVLVQGDAARLEDLAVEAGMSTRWKRACEMVTSGLTSPAEVRRVLGFGRPSTDRFPQSNPDNH